MRNHHFSAIPADLIPAINFYNVLSAIADYLVVSRTIHRVQESGTLSTNQAVLSFTAHYVDIRITNSLDIVVPWTTQGNRISASDFNVIVT